MPLYEWICPSNHTEEHISSITDRDSTAVSCGRCGQSMRRLPGGHGLLYFEEGRARRQFTLSEKPITSHAEHTRLMRINGVTECGNTVPRSVAKNPKSEAMRRYMSKDQRGRWI